MDQELKEPLVISQIQTFHHCSKSSPSSGSSSSSYYSCSYPAMRQALLAIDIKQISAVGFHYNMYKKDNKIFTTSLYKIDCLIEERL